MTPPDTGAPAPSPTGGELLARGREAEIWCRDERSVLKLYLAGTSRADAAREARVLEHLSAAGVRVPAMLGETTFDGRPGIVLERIAGTDLLTSLGRHPQGVLGAGKVLARAHLAMHHLVAPSWLPSMQARIRDRLASSPHLLDHERAGLLGLLESQEDGDRFCHGDLHLENLLGRPSSPVAVDWSTAAAGPPAADVARTITVLRFGDAPADAPRVVRRGAPLLRRLVISQYERAYRSLHPENLSRLEQWLVIQAAVRLGETTHEESARIRRWLRGSHLARATSAHGC